MKNHGRPLPIVPDITGVEATPLQVREAMSSTLTMIMMNPQRKTCGHKMNTATNAIPLPPHPENTGIMLAAQDVTHRPDIPLKSLDPPVLQDHTLRTHQLALKGVALHPLRIKDPQIPDLHSQGTGTPASTPVTLHPDTIIALVVSGGKGNLELPGGKNLLRPSNSNSNSSSTNSSNKVL